VSIGPGSFTGLRIGLSVAKGLAYATGKPLVPIPTLEALAQKAVEASGNGVATEYILPLLDARRGDVYSALYQAAGEDLLSVWSQRVMPLRTVAESLPAHSVLVTGEARRALEGLAREQFPGVLQRLHVVADDVARCSAAVVARIGGRLLQRGTSADPGLLEPEYLRDFHATPPH
jgi:tRNA threonylcarbamoyladenosine biosynthesis protein TsaB